MIYGLFRFGTLVPMTCLLALTACGGSGESEAEIAERARQLEQIRAENDRMEQLLEQQQAETRLREEQRQAEQVALERARKCDPLDTEQRQINDSFAQLRSDFPMTTSFLISCLRDARTEDDAAGCMIGACIGAEMGSGSDGGGCMDVGSRLAGIGERQSALNSRRRESLFSDCRVNVAPFGASL